jgi:hypothetical protein
LGRPGSVKKVGGESLLPKVIPENISFAALFMKRPFHHAQIENYKVTLIQIFLFVVSEVSTGR